MYYSYYFSGETEQLTVIKGIHDFSEKDETLLQSVRLSDIVALHIRSSNAFPFATYSRYYCDSSRQTIQTLGNNFMYYPSGQLVAGRSYKLKPFLPNQLCRWNYFSIGCPNGIEHQFTNRTLKEEAAGEFVVVGWLFGDTISNLT